MKIGEKIKKLRTEKSMTQSELAGSFITRNMLSLIESGSAQPSVQTILYLAERLNVPAGILVSDDNDEYFYRRMSLMENVRHAYVDGDYRICLDMCESMADEVRDDETALICAECLLGIAVEEFTDGRLKAACGHFDDACDRAQKTIYSTVRIEAEATVYCEYMRNISPSLYADAADRRIPHGLAENDPFCRYIMMLDRLADGNRDAVAIYVASLPQNDVLANHLRAKLQMTSRDHAEARHIMMNLLNGTESLPATVMYEVFCDLEICCRETGDFKGAYEYSGSKVVMLERLLSEDSL